MWLCFDDSHDDDRVSPPVAQRRRMNGMESIQLGESCIDHANRRCSISWTVESPITLAPTPDTVDAVDVDVVMSPSNPPRRSFTSNSFDSPVLKPLPPIQSVPLAPLVDDHGTPHTPFQLEETQLTETPLTEKRSPPIQTNLPLVTPHGTPLTDWSTPSTPIIPLQPRTLIMPKKEETREMTTDSTVATGAGGPSTTVSSSQQDSSSGFDAFTPLSQDAFVPLPPTPPELKLVNGRRKAMQISNAAMEQAKKRLAFQEESQPTPAPSPMAEQMPPPDFQLGFSSGRGKAVTISAAAIAQTKARIALDEQSQPEAPTPAQPPPDFQLGFSSGRGKTLAISASALAQAKARMALDEQSQPTSNSMEEAKTSAAHCNDDAMDTSDSYALPHAPSFPHGSEPPFVRFGKFSASGTFAAQTISAAAMAKAEAMFKDIDQDMMEDVETKNAEIMQPPPRSNKPLVGAAAAAEPAPNATVDSCPSTDDSFATPASKKRRSNFSTALPMPQDEDDDTFAPNSPTKPTTSIAQQQQPPKLQARPPMHTNTNSTDVSTPSSVTAAPPPPTNRKRPFVSPRVAAKPGASLLPPTPPAVNLLSVNRTPKNVNNVPMGVQSNGQTMRSPIVPAPSLGVSVALPSVTFGTPQSRVNLQRFAAACRAKADARQKDMLPPSTPWLQHTNIHTDFITAANASLVKFLRPEDTMTRQDGEHEPQPELGWMEARTSLLAFGLSSSLCSLAWVRNHYRWVVWKLASYQRRFGSALDHPPCTFEKVVQQLYARYEREINQVKIPALRKILEGDEAAGKFLVLMVAQVVGTKVPPSTVTGAPASSAWVDNTSGAIPTRPGGCEVELSDGWYSVWTKLDAGLFYQMQQGKIYPGQKLRIWGAQLVGPMPTTPLENSETYMKIQINSTRRAYWHTTLGVQKSLAFLVNFASLRPDGGLVPAIRAVVSRQYPMLYLHPSTVDPHAAPAQSPTNEAPSATPPGSVESIAPPPPKARKLHCNQRSHDIQMRLHERFCEQSMEKLQSAYLDRQARASSKTPRTREQIAEDEEEWQKQRSELEANLQEIHQQVTPYLKVHLCELVDPDAFATHTASSDDVPMKPSNQPLKWSGQCCALTIWRPNEEHTELMTPGREFILFGCAMHTRYKHLPGRKPPEIDPADLPAAPHQMCMTASANYLSLSTSRMTNIVPYALRHAKGVCATPLSSVVPLRTEFLRTPLYLRSSELLSLPRQSEFDCVCLVLWSNDQGDPAMLGNGSDSLKPPSSNGTGASDGTNKSGGPRWLRTRRLLCVGMSGEMMLVEVTETQELLHFTQPIQTPQIMLMENLQYTMYEKKLHLHTASATNVSRFTSKGVIQLSSPNLPDSALLSHSLHAHPSITQFQSWLMQPTTSLITHVVSVLAGRIREGWYAHEPVITTFNLDEFNHLFVCEVAGHFHPIMTDANTWQAGSAFTLDSFLALPPGEAGSDMDDSTEDEQPKHSSSTSHLMLKKRTPSLLTATHKTEGAATKQADADGIVAEDCRGSRDRLAVCYHPSHTLTYLLDSIQWNLLLLLDDAMRRWPVQLDTHAFRRIIDVCDPSVTDSAADVPDEFSLAAWWKHFRTTGEIPTIELEESVSTQQHSTITTELAKQRRNTFAHISQKFHMDETHATAQLADWIMLVLSHSRVSPASQYLRSVASPTVVTANILFSPTHEDQVRVEIKTPAGDATQIEIDSTHPTTKLSRTKSSSTTRTSLFSFTSSEWRALCDQLSRTIVHPVVECQLAECERPNQSAVNGTKIEPGSMSPISSISFRSVFIPKVDTINQRTI